MFIASLVVSTKMLLLFIQPMLWVGIVLVSLFTASALSITVARHRELRRPIHNRSTVAHKTDEYVRREDDYCNPSVAAAFFRAQARFQAQREQKFGGTKPLMEPSTGRSSTISGHLHDPLGHAASHLRTFSEKKGSFSQGASRSQQLGGSLTAGGLLSELPRRPTEVVLLPRDVLADPGFSAKSPPWIVLGITRNAPVGQIKQAYRNQMKRFHPDRYQNVTDVELAGLQFHAQLVQAAYMTMTQRSASLSH